VIGVGGCVASQEGEAITRRAPFVDLVFGPQTLHRLPEMIAELRAPAAPSWTSASRRSRSSTTCRSRAPRVPSAFVSIMEGCSKYCSFCVVPYTRGDEVSRPFDRCSTKCGRSRRRACARSRCSARTSTPTAARWPTASIVDLATLIHHVARDRRVERIRFTTSHPLEFNDSLIEAYASVPKLANHLHLPVQSGSDRILALMKRGYTALEFKDKIRRLRAVRPDISDLVRISSSASPARPSAISRRR
jgi:tRNA-2-methylthio-N6-dimethylallyladenosine synthase